VNRERIASIGLICLAASLAACTSKKDGAIDTAAVATAKAERPASLALPHGTLPSGWEGKNSEEFRAYVDSVQWTDPVSGERTCYDTKKCKKVAATISANADARLITAQNAGSGALMARMELQGPYETLMYRLTPGAHKYYVVVKPSAGGGDMHWQMVQVNDKGKDRITIMGEGTFYNCKHTPNPGAPAEADWRGCNNAKSTAQRLDSGGSSGGDQPGWVSCADGCCTVSVAQMAFNNVSGLLASAQATSHKKGAARN
jgi:hypothetical protein